MEGGRQLRPVMIAGTGSDVGKSVIATALCRILRQDGYHPAPFKAQNMALNSFITPDGLEIGRAQATQAEAAGLPPEADMNPVLLKPTGERRTQVVLCGKPIGNQDAYDYFRAGPGRERLRRAVGEAFDRLSARYNPIVIEGAGSVSELNLRATDLANMPMARRADARVILVCDIDRGGVFASAYGSVMLQAPEDRRRIKGIIVNKFRGDLRLFEQGRRLLEQVCGVPVLGVVPMFHDIHIEEEDSMELERKRRTRSAGQVNVAVVWLRHLANFTDFDALERLPGVNVYYAATPDDLAGADLIVLPGTKSTLQDLHHLRRTGMASALLRAHRAGTQVLGICGGYQIMGERVCDPEGQEGAPGELPGLGLLPMTTTIGRAKRTRQVAWAFNRGGGAWSDFCAGGYEIHQGISSYAAPHEPLVRFSDGTDDGCLLPGAMGTYVHGLFDHPAFAAWLLARLRPRQAPADVPDAAAWRQRQYDLLADHVRRHVDIDALYQLLRS